MMRMRAMAMLGVVVASASCAPKPAPEPERPPVPVTQLPPPQPAPPPPQPVIGWEDMPLTPGDWSYRADSLSAVYGDGLFTVRCDPASRRITLTRSGAAGGLAIRTSFGDRSLPGGAGGAMLPASDPLLEQIVFSRGRFAVEAEGQTRLILPTWAEPARVVEECKG
jgi:hypothetical protein